MHSRPGRPGPPDEKAPPEVRPRLQTTERWALAQHLLRLPELFALAKDRLLPRHFHRGDEPHLRMAWSAALELADATPGGRLPDDPDVTWAALAAACDGRLEYAESTGRSGREEIGRTRALLFGDPAAGEPGLFARAFDRAAVLDPDWGRRLLRDFLRERTVDDYVRRAALAGGEHALAKELPAFLAEAQQRYHQVQSLGKPMYRSAAPAGYVPKGVRKSTTHLPFLDNYLHGGDAPGEVYGLLGAYGGGKTTLAVQMACEKAKLLRRLHEQHGQPLRHAFLFHYESDFDEVMLRAWSYEGKIHKDSLEVVEEGYPGLSRRGALKGYEKALFKNEIRAHGEANVAGEYERLLQAQQAVLGHNLQLCDFGGELGSGYVDEVAACLEQASRDGNPPGAVYIDYAGICCRRYLSARSLPVEHLRHYLGDFGNQCRYKVADRFGVPVWVFHQLSAAANARSFAARQHHSDAAEARNFAENLWFCFQLSTQDRESGLVQLECTKHRRSPGLKHPPLLRLRGELCRFEEDNNWVLDPVQGKPVPRAEALETLAGLPLGLSEDVNLTGYEEV